MKETRRRERSAEDRLDADGGFKRARRERRESSVGAAGTAGDNEDRATPGEAEEEREGGVLRADGARDQPSPSAIKGVKR
jgi:hypothetical protein